MMDQKIQQILSLCYEKCKQHWDYSKIEAQFSQEELENSVRGRIEQEKNPYFRYENDVWYFGILLITGITLVIECIVKEFDEYIEVIMKEREDVISLCRTYDLDPKLYMSSPCDRTVAMVRKENIVAIFEMADT